MKKNNGIQFIFLSSMVFILIIILFSLFHLVQYEGFNPSDDGVIAAESFRLMHGEMPHRDFIAIRPAGSGYLHILDFILPLPMMEAGRWITIFEYFFYSTVWIFLILSALKISSHNRRSPMLVSSALLIGFCLTFQIKQVFPWTTVDAIFFSSAAILFLIRAIDVTFFKLKIFSAPIIAFIFFSMAALCRQTFVFPLFVSGLVVLIAGYRSRKLLPAIFAGLAGILPLLIYIFYLVANSAFPDFIDQMTGRTELFKTGIFQYGKHLFYTPWLALYLIYAFILSALKYKKNNLRKYLKSADGLTGFIIFGCAIAMFFPAFQKTIPFVFFWTVLYLSMRLYLQRDRGIVLFLSFAGLVVSWTGSISLGDNSPLFCSGILISIITMQLIQINKISAVEIFRKYKKQIHLIIPAIGIVLIIFTIYFQGRYNYRDLDRKYLTENLNDYFPEMGNIHTGANTRLYFEELMRLKNDLQIPSGQLVVLPNNAAIYPLLNSPLPILFLWTGPRQMNISALRTKCLQI